MILPFHLGERGALSFAFLVSIALAFILVNPIAQADLVPTLLPRGSVRTGGKCAINTDCYSKNCVNKICQLQPTGGPCFKDGNCVSKICSIPQGKTTGTCKSQGTLYPKAPCTANSQCLSGSCASLVDRHDKYGDITGHYLSDDPNHQGKNCQYLGLGQSGCRSNLDCGNGVCSKNGVCTAVANGSGCLFNNQCAKGSVCSLKGHCYTPAPASLRTGHVCSDNSQCYNRLYGCSVFLPNITRPSLDGKSTVTLGDYTCGKAALLQACYVDSDCQVGACLPIDDSNPSVKSCTLSLVGESCPRDLACSSGVCSTKTQKCELASTGHQCTSDSGCFSNSCSTGYCYNSGTEYSDCPHSSCNPVLYLGKCRFDKDCDTADGGFCNNNGQCDKKSSH